MHRTLPLLLMLALLIVFRALGAAFPQSMPNLQPLAALFFCGALLASGWRGFALPLLAWLISYPLPLVFQGHHPVANLSEFSTTLLAFGVTFVIGRALAQRSAATLLLGSFAAALGFHLITNGAAWLVDPRYAKSLTGLWQSQWTGAPGAPLPSWLFLRNFAAANLIFTAIVLAARLRLPRLAATRSTAAAAPAAAAR